MDSQKRAKEIRDHLHGIAEPSMQEKETSKYLANILKQDGFEVQENVFGYGLIATLKGVSNGPVVAVRADMDALVHNVDGKDCFMHTCGHDANCAIAVTAFEEMKKEGLPRGTIKLILQPAEENLKGAAGMADAGAVSDVDYLLGIHLRPAQEAKLGEATPALCHGSSAMMVAHIKGFASHGARPHLGVNVIDAGAMIVNGINAIHLDPSVPWSAKVTKFNSNGKIINAIPDGAELAFDLRAQSNPLMEELKKKVVFVINSAASINGATAEINDLGTVPGSDYDDDVTDLMRQAIVEVLGDKGLLPEIITPGGDDFHFYKIKKPSLKAGFIGIGADLTPGLHNTAMKFDEKALGIGVKLVKSAIRKVLQI